MGIGRKIAIGSAVSCVIFFLVGLVAYHNTRRLLETEKWVDHTHAVLLDLRELSLHHTTIESLQRGYILTGQEAAVSSFERVRASIEALLAKLDTLTSDNEAQARRVRELRDLSRRKLDFAALTIAQRRTLGRDAAIARLSDGEGFRLMDAIEATSSEMVGAEQELLEQRERSTEIAARVTLMTILAGTSAALLAAIAASRLLVRAVKGPVGEAVGQLSTTAAELLAGAQQQVGAAQDQAAAVSQSVATVAEITQTADNAASRASTLGASVQRSAEVSEVGRRAVEQAISAVEIVREQIALTAASVGSASSKAQAIAAIIATVNDIAEQTNMLALNAAIEASRAGEQGKGFAVVAAEIKALAGQSKAATVQVREILGDIASASGKAAMAADAVTKSANEAARVVVEAGGTIRMLAETANEASKVGTQIVASAGQQANGMKQINQAMRDLENTARQNMAATRQIEQAARDLNALGLRLRGLTDG